jgi:diadenosine tetraphosphate (Ap4A) HIT family hydrolase
MNDSPRSDCPFCSIPADRVVAANDHAIAVRDAYPVTPGHSLVIAKRHVASFFDLNTSESVAMVELLKTVRLLVEREIAPSGYNIGINVGQAAGQTILHVHIHLIPRNAGDVTDPTGGVRNVIPGRGRYDAAL